ncbi:MAG TPA: hypothetical protein VNN74_05515 [Candidatus Micrarchaeia archaeon]|nr:hypothetical protein [Candidatus Micrarchaeia archaeon]
MAHRPVPAPARSRGQDRRRTVPSHRSAAGAGWLTVPRFLTASGLLVAMLAVPPAITDPDFWWHLRTGATLLRTHRLIATDPYTFTAVHHHWVLQEWLTELGYAALSGGGARAALVVGFELVALFMLAAILLRARLLHPVGAVSLGLGAVVTMLAGAPVWGPRPQMETYLLLAVTLWLAERQLRRGGRAALWLPPIFLLWSNLEAGWVLGLGLLLVVLAVEGARRWAGGRAGPAARDLRRLASATLFALLAILVNPNGPQILVYPFQTQFDTVQQRLIQEWHSPDFHLVALWPFLALLLSLFVLLLRYRRCSLRDTALLLLVTPLALQSVRQTAVFAVVAAPVWIAQLDGAVTELAGRRRRPRTLRRPPLAVRLAAGLELGAILAVLATRVAAAAVPAGGSAFYVPRFPVCAAHWLSRAPGRLRLFNLYQDGGYLIDHLPEDRVFVFGDAALMGNGVLLRFAAVAGLAPGWLGELDRSRTQLVVYERGTPLAQALGQVRGWPLVYHDRRMDVFARADSPARLHLPATPTAAGWRRAGLAACIAERPAR